MCNQVVVLARLDHRRWISCCEHEKTHLMWDNVSVRIPLPQIQVLGKALLECAQVAQHFRIAGTTEVCVIFDQYDLYQVWFGGVGLCLSPADFKNFCQLVSDACEHPATQASANRGESTPASPVVDAPIRTPYHLFSVN